MNAPLEETPDPSRSVTIALIGNPNSGKTTLFNALTGLRQKVGNYPGVTVERRIGTVTRGHVTYSIIDLPGTYSLTNRSPDEEVAVDVLLGRMPGEPLPDVILNVCDASNLGRNLFLTTQILELEAPVVVALTMTDIVADDGIRLDCAAIEAALGCPVCPVRAHEKGGADALFAAIERTTDAAPARRVVTFPPVIEAGVERLRATATDRVPFGVLLRRLLADPADSPKSDDRAHLDPDAIRREQSALAAAGIEWWRVEAEERYRWIDRRIESLAPRQGTHGLKSRRMSERVDGLLLHRIFGPLAFITLMAFIFQMVFSWAEWPMERMEDLVARFSAFVAGLLGPGALKDLVTDGMIAGVGNVLVFLPQILMLFIALGLLEDSGYLARGAVIMDRLMSKVGLQGKSFVPLLSSFACAIPGIMSTRSIENRSARLITILIAPLMSCSARLPVYTLLIGAFFSHRTVFGFVSLAGLVMAGLYGLGILTAVGMAFLLRRTVASGEPSTLVLELPPYRRPDVFSVLRNAIERAMLFVQKAGTVILGLSVLLWFLQAYPKSESIRQEFAPRHAALEVQKAEAHADPAREAEIERQILALDGIERAAQLRESYAGRLGRLIEPAIRPLGFDWRIGIGLVASFAAREVLVSTLAIVFDVPDDASGDALTQALAAPPDGHGGGGYRALTALSLLVFFVLACQCMSTLAVVRRETNTWRWPLFLLGYMTVLAWTASFAVFRIGTMLGY